MSRIALLLLSSLAIWAAWFVLAYALHGTQCSGAWAASRAAGQGAQVALWIGALACAGGLEGWLRRSVEPDAGEGVDAPLLRGARVARGLGVVASVFVGLPVLVLAPC